MAYEVAPPKYVRLIQALQARIEDGTYPPGTMLPSEHQLVQAFGMSRPTVVRALSILRQDGWIESQQGRGTFVRGNPRTDATGPDRRGLAVLDRDEDLGAGHRVTIDADRVPPRISSLLGIPPQTDVLHRRVVVEDEDGPSELVTYYFPTELARVAGLDEQRAIVGGVRRRLEERVGVRFDRVTERTSARMPSESEADLLVMPKGEPVLSVLAVAQDVSGRALVVVDVVLPAGRHELEDTYRLS